MIAMDSYNRKRQRLEWLHLARHEQGLQSRLRQRRDSAEAERELRIASKIGDGQLIRRLVSAGIRRDTLAGLARMPLALVAWASGSVTWAEHRLVLLQLAGGQPPVHFRSRAMVQSWLEQRPPRELSDLAWDYALARTGVMHPRWRVTFGERLLDEARQVAAASGGLLGVGAVCLEEQRVLDRIRATYGLR